MRICHVCVRFGAPGGAEMHVKALVKGLAERGHDVTVVTSDLYTEVPWSKDGDFEDPPEGVDVIRLPMVETHVPHRRIFMDGLADTLRKVDADVYHAHSHRYEHVKRTALTARSMGRPYCITPHFHPIEDKEPAWKHAAAVVSDLVDRVRTYHPAARVFTVTEREKTFMRHLATKRQMVTVPNGIHVDRWRDPPAADVFRTAHTDGRDYVLYAGRLATNKGLTHLVDAWADVAPRHPDVDLVLMGADWGLGDDLRTRAKGHGLAERVRILGHVSDRDYVAGVAGCRLFVLPSEWEAFGIVLLEAMAAGRPVVATSVGGVPSVVDEERDGLLVPYGDAGALADAMGRLLADPDLARRLGAAGREKAPRYDWDRIVDALENEYRAVTRST